MKSYTNIEQSNKLVEILSPESADMIYCYTKKEDKLIYPIPIYLTGTLTNTFKYLYCWSLSALLSVLDFLSLTQNKEDEWEVCVPNHKSDGYIEISADNPVNACMAMIEKLHELKLL